MGQGNSLLRRFDRGKNMTRTSPKSEARQRSGVRRARRTSSTVTAPNKFKRPCPGQPDGVDAEIMGNASATVGSSGLVVSDGEARTGSAASDSSSIMTHSHDTSYKNRADAKDTTDVDQNRAIDSEETFSGQSIDQPSVGTEKPTSSSTSQSDFESSWASDAADEPLASICEEEEEGDREGAENFEGNADTAVRTDIISNQPDADEDMSFVERSGSHIQTETNLHLHSLNDGDHPPSRGENMLLQQNYYPYLDGQANRQDNTASSSAQDSALAESPHIGMRTPLSHHRTVAEPGADSNGTSQNLSGASVASMPSHSQNTIFSGNHAYAASVPSDDLDRRQLTSPSPYNALPAVQQVQSSDHDDMNELYYDAHGHTPVNSQYPAMPLLSMPESRSQPAASEFAERLQDGQNTGQSQSQHFPHPLQTLLESQEASLSQRHSLPHVYPSEQENELDFDQHDIQTESETPQSFPALTRSPPSRGLRRGAQLRPPPPQYEWSPPEYGRGQSNHLADSDTHSRLSSDAESTNGNRRSDGPRHLRIDSTDDSDNEFPDLEQMEEDRLVGQLSRTLFTAVLLIASHAVNTSDDPPPPAEGMDDWANSVRNRNAAVDSFERDINGDSAGPDNDNNRNTQSRSTETFREEVTRRIWNALHDHSRNRDSANANPVYNQSNISRLEEITTLGGEPFLSFMDQLWDGSLNGELSRALSGRESFFRIFRFPRDTDNRFPVLVLRVTSIIDRTGPPTHPDMASEDIAAEDDVNNGNTSDTEGAHVHEHDEEISSEGSSDDYDDFDDEDDNDFANLDSARQRSRIVANEGGGHNINDPLDPPSSDSEDDLFTPRNEQAFNPLGAAQPADELGIDESSQTRSLNRELGNRSGGYAGRNHSFMQETSNAIRREHERRVHLESLASLQRAREERNAHRRAEARASANRRENRNANLLSARTNRSWITYVVRGSFPENHPIFSASSLMSNHPNQEDLELLDQLFMPGKTQTATQEDVDAAGGLFTIELDSDLIGDRCPVCLIDYEVEDQCRKLKCSHSFHKECVDSWLVRSHNSCPMCRQEGVPLSSREHRFPHL